MANFRQSTVAKLLSKHQNEGSELVEYALTSVFVSVGVALILSGAGAQFTQIWNIVAGLILK